MRLFYFKYDDDDYVSEMDEKVVMINLELTGVLYADDVTPKKCFIWFLQTQRLRGGRSAWKQMENLDRV